MVQSVRRTEENPRVAEYPIVGVLVSARIPKGGNQQESLRADRKAYESRVTPKAAVVTPWNRHRPGTEIVLHKCSLKKR